MAVRELAVLAIGIDGRANRGDWPSPFGLGEEMVLSRRKKVQGKLGARNRVRTQRWKP